MIETLYGKYFQKSRSFLYPALGIKRNSNITPTGTYLSLEGKIGPEDMKLIVAFKHDDSEGYKTFEDKMLLTNPLYEDKISVKEYNLYIFNFEMYKDDWFNFLLGKYSKLSNVLKRAIKSYYGESSSEFKYMETYIYPEKFIGVYSKMLNVDIATLKEVGELCDPCDLKKEILKISVKDFELLEKSN
jgi:hypothetical protein